MISSARFAPRHAVVFVWLALLLAACAPGATRTGDIALTATPQIGKFVWHDLVTDDVGDAKRFYSGLFGWTFENARGPAGGSYTLVLADGIYIGGMVPLEDPAGADYSRWLGYLSVPDVDAAVSATEAAGGAGVVAPLDIGTIGRAAAVQDPQGAVVGLLRSAIGDPDDAMGPAAGRVLWNELVAADADAAASFYGELAGYRANPVQRNGGRYTFLEQAGKPRAGVLQRPDDNIQPLWLTYFAIGDVQAASHRAAQLGGKVLLAPDATLRNGTMAVIEDPTGAVFALQQLDERRNPAQ